MNYLPPEEARQTRLQSNADDLWPTETDDARVNVECDECDDTAKSLSPLWVTYSSLLTASFLWILHTDGIHTLTQSIFLLLLALCVLAIAIPATGPRNQRIPVLPSLGMAAVLVLPFPACILPIAIANGIQAATRTSRMTRHTLLRRGFWMGAAGLIAGYTATLFSHAGKYTHIAGVGTACFVYFMVYCVGRRIDVHLQSRKLRQSSAQAMFALDPQFRLLTSWRMDVITLLMGVPASVSTGFLYAKQGIDGAEVGSVLIMLLLLIGHFGFEAALLREQVRALEKLSTITLSQTSHPRIIDKFLRLSAPLLSSDRTLFWLTNDSSTRLEMVALQITGKRQEKRLQGVADTSMRTLVFGEGLVGRTAERKSPLILKHPSLDPRFAPAECFHRADEVTSLLLMPLIVSDEVVGVAQFERQGGASFTKRDISRIRALGAQAAATMANVRTHQDIYNQAVTDELTQLFNRRHMQCTLTDELRRAERYGHELSLVLLDVDGFKSYNDTYGHPQGDTLLKMLSAILRDSVRNVDIVGRYGGEEFIVIMPETSKLDAWHISQRLRKAVASTTFPGDPGTLESVVRKSISLGVATYPGDTVDAQSLILKADQALYQAKNNGRNRVIVCGELDEITPENTPAKHDQDDGLLVS